ncbi:MAG: ParB/RepB/Spo0J family partition protein [Clostridia bacterium]|nr:ParB/RepB/Spo0J family partition protein [Clostridia bacterium]
MAEKRALGRGLDIIFDDNSFDRDAGGVLSLRISDVEPKSDQPRKNFDNEALSQLADSIAANGVLQPILVREIGGGRYQIIAGERRWRASKLAGLTEIPSLVMDADDLQTAQIALIENIQREDLNSYEEAQAYRALMNEFGLTQEEVAGKLGKSRSSIANSLRLLELPEEISTLLKGDMLTAGHCKALLGLRDRSGIAALAEKIIKNGMSVREAENAVKQANRKKSQEDDGEAVVVPVKVDYIAELEKKVTGITGRYCKIQTKGARTTVTLEYGGDGDLEALLSKICGVDITE